MVADNRCRWVFIATSWILINGIGMSRSTLICSLGIYACIFAYASTKVR